MKSIVLVFTCILMSSYLPTSESSTPSKLLTNGAFPMNEIWRDIKHTGRSLRKTPGFLIVVVLTLGLGIGANAAIFSLMDQVLLRPLPVHDPASLVLLDGPGAFRGRTLNAMTFSYPMYQDFRDRNQVFTGVLARVPLAMTAVWRGASERANGELVSGNFFD